MHVIGLVLMIAGTACLARDNIEAMAFGVVGACWIVCARLLLPND